MSTENPVTEVQIDAVYAELRQNAAAGGYHLNPDVEFTRELVRGILTNQNRYGYRNCPCRLASGLVEEDRDIICPCDYRDADVTQFGACYCGLYVSEAIASGRQALEPVPERRPSPEKRTGIDKQPESPAGRTRPLSDQSFPAGPPAYPVWRCRVCGYLCARDSPPDLCPICKAGRERFERFM